MLPDAENVLNGGGAWRGMKADTIQRNIPYSSQEVGQGSDRGGSHWQFLLVLGLPENYVKEEGR